MNKILLFLFIGMIAVGCVSLGPSGNQTKPDKSQFCGTSTNGACSSDTECVRGGCSNSICHSTSETPPITTCEYKECYSAGIYGVECGCVSGKCQWR